MKIFYKSYFTFLLLIFPFLSSFAQWEKEYFKDKDSFFFFIGVHNFTDVHLVWDEIQPPALKEFTLERSDDGKNYSPVITHNSAYQNPPDIIHLPQESIDSIIADSYNRLFYTTETGTGRYIYNQLIPDFMVNNKKYQWHYRIKFSWKDGTTTYSGERSFDFFWKYRSMVDRKHDGHSHSAGESTHQHMKEIILEENSKFHYQPITLKTDQIPAPLAPCPGVTTPPPGACSTGSTQNLTGTCCTYTQTLYEYPSVNCMGTCCCNIDCSPSSFDTCCVHNCNQHAVCGCTPWACCGGSNQWVVTTSTPATPPTVTVSSTSSPCASGNSATASVSGGMPGYTYLWSPGGYTSSTISNVPPGNYTVTVTDANGCSATTTVTVNAGSPTPTAIFISGNVCLGQPTTFTDQSTISSGSITGWNWNFGGPPPNTSTQQNPSFTYTAAGNYTVTLTVTSNNGCSATITNVVTVYPQPVANFSATSVCINNPTQFTDLSTGGAASWSWNFGDGNTSTQQNPSNTYASAGNYTVTLTVTGVGGCTATILLPVTVYAQANANFTATAVCVNTPPTQFTDMSTGASTWAWNFGDPSSGPNNTSNSQNPSHSYSTAGTYTVILIVASGNGCMDTITQIITVNPMPAAAFSATTVCFNNPTVFTDLSTGGVTQWNWNFGGSNTSTVQNPSFTFNAPGTYSVTLVVTNNFGCKDSIMLNVIVHPLPFANFSAATVCVGNTTCFYDSTTISSGTITGWSWNFGDPSSPNNISNVQNPCHVYTAAGNYVTILTSTSNNGCQSTVNLPVTVNSLPVAAFTASNVCMNSNTIFTDASTNSVQWYWAFGDGNTSTQQNPSHMYLGYGTYVVTLMVTSGGSCADTITGTVTVYPLPVVNFAADSVCVGELTSFSDLSFIPSGNISTWNWNFGDLASGTNNTSSQQNPTHLYTAPGNNYNATLVVSSNNGCVSTVTLLVMVYPLPAADFSFEPVSPVGLTDVVAFSDLSIGNVTQWYWLFGDGDSSAVQNPSYLYSDTGVYIISLAVISDHGCVDTVQYPLEILDYTFYIPNVFSPNNDGKNEFFFGVGIGIAEYEMWIFDRWGNRIFYCKVNGLPQMPACMWNGKVDGGISEKRVQEDVYVWKVHLTNVFKKEFNYMGTVSVIR